MTLFKAKFVENQAKKEIEQSRIEADLAGKKLQYETQLAVAQINASKDANQSYADREQEILGLAAGHAHEVAMSQMEHDQGMEAAQQQAQNAQLSQSADQQHEAGMAEQAQQAQQAAAQSNPEQSSQQGA